MSRLLSGALALLVFSFVLAGSVRAEDEYLPIVFEDYPPYEYVEDGQVKGINLEIIREAFRRMGVKPYFEPRPWKRGILQLQQGEILALSSGFKNPERENFAFFPAPLSLESNAIVELVDSGIKVEKLEDIRGLHVGVVTGYTYGEEFDKLTGYEKTEAQSSQQLLRLLLNKRIDVAVINKAVIRYLAKKEGKEDQLSFLYDIGSEPLYLMFSRAGGRRVEALAKRFGEAVRAMKADGTFQAIEAKY